MIMQRRVRAIAKLLFFLAVPSAVQAQTAHPTRQLSGAIQSGVYTTLDLKAQSKLWLTRFTSPGMLINYDACFVYEKAAFCAVTAKSKDRAFHTPRYAVARKDGERYEVTDAMQLKKIDFCATSASNGEDYVILSKEILDDQSPRILINWATGGAVKGIASAQSDAVDTPSSSAQPAVANMLIGTARSATMKDASDRALVGLYADVLKGEGVLIKYTSPREGADKPRYCIRDFAAKTAEECFDTFPKAAEKVLAGLRAESRSAPARSADAKVRPSAEAKPVRYELSIAEGR